ncbi:myo-inosose-2 dehydratase [Halomonas dongshanensis]|uniref:Myo-inosose-2 dehydratase n=1 Tax=Halomonas dongshanensis TaxID=2890835 RepID=A0ABT2E9B5_9GAMM|nr:myo-inosose-2 dehydratase [Halomonas dongshanensis]MCS2608151.1 myo-inosose-2 dehydratase [Halomonas dongshanensis]
MSVRLGINPLTWTNDDMPELGGDTPLEHCLAEARQAGFAGVELGYKFPRDVQTLAPLLQTASLALASGWYSSHLLERSVEEEIAALTPHLGLLKALGAKTLVFCDMGRHVYRTRQTPLSHSPLLSETEWRHFTQRLDQVAAYCQAQGVQLAYHHHLGTLIETPAEIERLLSETSSAVGLLLDTGHLSAAGGDPVALYQAHAARIHHVHCKDVRHAVLADARNRDLSFLDAVLNGLFTVPGDGNLAFAPLLAALKKHGYAGWLVVEAEQDPAIAHPLTYARLGHDNLRRLCIEAQLDLAE